MSHEPHGDALDLFHPHVATWFRDVFDAPTAVQNEAWGKIAAGEHVLVVAPTGSGKTLAAFLWAINQLAVPVGQTTLPTMPAQPVAPKDGGRGVRVLYISPLKALGVDVEHNLRAPLTGIAQVAERLGAPAPNITVGVRSGDTPASERSKQVRRPPEVLITTPESAYLMLTSKAAAALADVETVIIDEIHAVAGTKRGAHLAVTLERLEQLVGRPIQRIGLSATVRPLSTVAQFLGGDREVQIVDPPLEKRWELDVCVPVEDMTALDAPTVASSIGDATLDDALGLSVSLEEAGDGGLDAELNPGDASQGTLALAQQTPDATPPLADFASESALPQQGSIWPFIEEEVYEKVMAGRSTLVFVNSRRTAERLTSRLNELYAMRHAPETLSPALRRDPAQLMKPVDVAGQAPAVIARAHHGSVSKDERALTETMLKEGSLKAVVATSSLELGIDMGAVDQVLQVESPPSVASALQRVGRAGHVVGAVSRGTFYPKHRADLVQTAVTVARMREGKIEELKVPSNPLDVLVQHTIAAVAVEDWDVELWYATVIRAYPYRQLSRDVFNAVIDLAAGAYPSTDFSELRPRITFDRVSGTLSARPGAKRVAVTSGGTIPDRGLFGVYLAGGEGMPRRVGELDEEMVYESRVGDVFTLGASSWRIEEITRDQVLVTPAPGHTGRLPFWSGDQAGRPAELGRALGAFRRHVLADPSCVAHIGLDAHAQANLVRFLQDQQEATGLVPDERTLVLERFRDELGDWRVVLHTPYGRGVNAAWALAVGARVAELTGMDAQAVASDDGIVLRLPEGEHEPDASLFLIEPREIEEIVSQQVGNSALFASRFRECAARALLLPRKHPGKRAPLWQQRQRAAQLLDVARKYPSFPIILETVRECLRDVYDLPALQALLEDVQQRRVRIAEVTTEQPSPFAASILFTYTGAFMYEGDTPLAEKRAAALSLDPALLAQLLGTLELRELLDPAIIDATDADLRRVSPSRRARDAEQLADSLRILGPIPVEDLPAHCVPGGIGVGGDVDAASAPMVGVDNPVSGEAIAEAALQALGKRVMRVRIAGNVHLAQAQDAPLLRDALGVPVPPGIPAQVATIDDALEQLVARWSRTRGPFTAADLTGAFGLAVGMAHSVLAGLAAQKRLVEGRYRQGIEDREWVAPEVLKTIRQRSLADARQAIEPVSTSALGRFLPDWQQVAPVGTSPEQGGADAVFGVIEQLAGVRLPASAWESLVLPQRVRNYSPNNLDELTASGEVLVVGAGTAGASDPWVMLLPADYAAELALPPAEGAASLLQDQIVEVLSRGGSFLYATLRAEVTGEDLGLVAGQATDEQLREAMWGLFEAGVIAPDSFGPIRARLAGSSGGTAAHRSKRQPQRGRLRMGRTRFAQARRSLPPDMAGRWSLAVPPSEEPTARNVALGESWLERYGVVTRGSVVAEQTLGGFARAYKVLSEFEASGKAMRGYVVDGLGGAQFSTPAVIDRIRGMHDTPDVAGWPSGTREPSVYLLAATDPANPYGAALPWPAPMSGCSRAAGAMVVLADGLAIAHLTRGGRTLTMGELPGDLGDALLAATVVEAVDWAVRHGWVRKVVVEKINGDPALQSRWCALLRAAGASMTPRGVRLGAAVGTQHFGTQQRSGSALGRGETGEPPAQGGFRSGGWRR